MYELLKNRGLREPGDIEGLKRASANPLQDL